MASLLHIVRNFWRAREGAVAIYVAVVSVALAGFGALVVDASRVYTLQTELQNAGDAAATAGAAELDLTSTSITRARAAAKTAFANNFQTFAIGGKNVTIQDSNIRFLSSLPADDDAPIPESSVTTDPKQARFIEVTTSVREVNFLLGPVFAALQGGSETDLSRGKAQATSICGMETVVCKFPPLMICNPDEANGNTGADFTPLIGTLLVLKDAGGSSAWAPGNFGLLDPPLGPQGATQVAQSIASSDPEDCFRTRVNLRTGSATNPVSSALNTRFDMYEQPGFSGSAKNNSDYRPAPNVTKGKYLSGSSYVNYAGSPPAGRAMPLHPCLTSGTCADLGPYHHQRFAPPVAGNLSAQQGFWADYWATNHPGESFSSHYSNGDLDPNGDGIVTRNEMYDWEVASSVPVGDTNGDGEVTSADASTASSATGENGHPMNYGGSVAPDPKRRIIYVAVINCQEVGPINGNSENVPVKAYAKMFLVRPAEGGSEQTIYAEVVGVLIPNYGGTDIVMHDIVTLRR